MANKHRMLLTSHTNNAVTYEWLNNHLNKAEYGLARMQKGCQQTTLDYITQP